ncbi:MAG TPA: hypothetical protein DDW52_16625 [Planctomycetaceae bacterium]|nr:hypothetical protein [Planctomycetaceae bacterium]
MCCLQFCLHGVIVSQQKVPYSGTMRKPYFKRGHQCWYVKDSGTGREIRLDPDEDKAYELWRELIDSEAKLTSRASYRRLAEECLKDTYEDSKNYHKKASRIAAFAKFIGAKQALKINRKDVVKWLNEDKPGQKRKDGSRSKIKWSTRTKFDALREIKTVYKWAIKKGIVPTCPFEDLTVPKGAPRSSTLTPEQHQIVLDGADVYFRRYLQACASGVRPIQVREVTALNVSPDFQTWVFQTHKTAHKTGKPLIVYLPPCLQTMTRILVAKYPKGPLFRNTQGNPWKKDTVVRKFRRLREKLGLPNEIVNYSYRHTFATDALLSGASIHDVAKLLGHTSTDMVDRVYGHLDQHKHYLVQVAAKATAKR